MKESIWQVYKISGPKFKAYIGISKQGAAKRFKGHIESSKGNSKNVLHRAMRKYGVENFRLTILTECYSLSEANKCERALIAAHRTYLSAGGYNMTIGGDCGQTDPEVRARMAASNKGKHSQPWKLERLRELGRQRRGIKLSPETVAKMAEGHRGLKASPQTVAKQKEAWKRRKARPEGMGVKSGYKHTEETIAKMQLSAQRRAAEGRNHQFLTEEHKAKLSDAQQARYEKEQKAVAAGDLSGGSLATVNAIQKLIHKPREKLTDRIISEEHKAATSAKMKGKPKSPEHIAALKIASQARWAKFKEEKARLLAELSPDQKIPLSTGQ